MIRLGSLFFEVLSSMSILRGWLFYLALSLTIIGLTVCILVTTPFLSV